MNELLGLPYSPWTEKARWALDARQVTYAFRFFSPLLGEPRLRAKLGRWRGEVTVPILTDESGKVYPDSLDIARWADARGEGASLFPRKLDAEILRFVALSERGLAAGRAISLRRMLDDPPALAELIPRNLREFLGPVGPYVAGLGVRRTLRKYRAASLDHDAYIGVLDEIRAAISGAPRAPLLGSFTFADIAASQVLSFVSPPAFGLRLGQESRRAFTDVEMKARYADLIEWRDAMYLAHRPRD